MKNRSESKPCQRCQSTINMHDCVNVRSFFRRYYCDNCRKILEQQYRHEWYLRYRIKKGKNPQLFRVY